MLGATAIEAACAAVVRWQWQGHHALVAVGRAMALSEFLAIEVLTARSPWSSTHCPTCGRRFPLSRIRAPETPAVVDAAPSVLGDILIGLRACLAHPLIGPALIADSVMGFFSGFFFALYMLLALEALVLSPATVGIIISVGGIGAFVGTMIAPRWVVSTVRDAHGAVPRPGPSRDPVDTTGAGRRRVGDPLLVLQQLVGDAFLVAYVIHAISLRQRVLPAVLGRANATFHVIPGLLLPAGALVAGPLANVLGLSAALWIGACGACWPRPCCWRRHSCGGADAVASAHNSRERCVLEQNPIRID